MVEKSSTAVMSGPGPVPVTSTQPDAPPEEKITIDKNVMKRKPEKQVSVYQALDKIPRVGGFYVDGFCSVGDALMRLVQLIAMTGEQKQQDGQIVLNQNRDLAQHIMRFLNSPLPPEVKFETDGRPLGADRYRARFSEQHFEFTIMGSQTECIRPLPASGERRPVIDMTRQLTNFEEGVAL